MKDNDSCTRSWARWARNLIGEVVTGIVARILIAFGILLLTIYGRLDEATLTYLLTLVGLAQ
jgi:hypothetical protein